MFDYTSKQRTVGLAEFVQLFVLGSRLHVEETNPHDPHLDVPPPSRSPGLLSVSQRSHPRFHYADSRHGLCFAEIVEAFVLEQPQFAVHQGDRMHPQWQVYSLHPSVVDACLAQRCKQGMTVREHLAEFIRDYPDLARKI